MLNIRSISIQVKARCLLLSIGFAVAAVATVTRWNVEAKGQSASAPQRPAMAPASGKVNGKIAFAGYSREDGTRTIWTMNPDGSNRTQLTHKPDDPLFLYDGSPKWSPDGRKIAFLRWVNGGRILKSSIYVMKADGSDLQQVVVDQSGINGAISFGSIDWSPDGTKFLFDAGSFYDPYVLGRFYPSDIFYYESNLFTSGLDGKNVVRLTNDKRVVNGPETWSPDGKMIAFGSYNGPSIEIQVMNADGSNRRTIAKGFGPSWSPDGSKILFVSLRSTEDCDHICNQLFTVNPDGSNLTQLTYYAQRYRVLPEYIGPNPAPKWSPDGEKIVFGSGMGRSFGDSMFLDYGFAVFVMDADGSNQTNISNSDLPGLDYQPDWQSISAPLNDPPPSVLGFSEPLYQPACCSPTVELRVTRTGNLNQAVSCDYQREIASGSFLLPITISFAPGETSKTIQIPSGAITTKVHLSNNVGNATFVGGYKNTTVLFLVSNANPIDNPAFFVRQHYRDFLNREPDPLGMDFWTDHLEFGDYGEFCELACQQVKRINTSAAFFLSIEFQETGYLVYRIYKAAYGNLPGAQVPLKFNEFLPDTKQIGSGAIVGQSNWQQQLETNKRNFISEFVVRPRFIAAYPMGLMPSQFVDALYANAGVAPSETERMAAIAEFAAGAVNTADTAARARVLRRVAENQALAQQEFNRAFVLMQYFGYLRRDPNDSPDFNFDGYNFWLNKLNSFNGNFVNAEMVKAFVTSSEYRQRFGP